MNCRATAVPSALALILAATATACAADPAAGEIAWRTDLKAAHEVSVDTGRPMVIVFGAEWCGYCRKMERDTLSDRTLAKALNEKFVPVHLDFDEHRKVAEVLEVKSIPHVVVLSPEADLLGRVVGYRDRKAFAGSLAKARTMHDRLRKLRVAAGETGTSRN